MSNTKTKNANAKALEAEHIIVWPDFSVAAKQFAVVLAYNILLGIAFEYAALTLMMLTTSVFANLLIYALMLGALIYTSFMTTHHAVNFMCNVAPVKAQALTDAAITKAKLAAGYTKNFVSETKSWVSGRFVSQP